MLKTEFKLLCSFIGKTSTKEKTKDVKKEDTTKAKAEKPEAAGKEEPSKTQGAKKGKNAKGGDKKPANKSQKDTESKVPIAAVQKTTEKSQDTKGKKGKQKGGKGKQKSADKGEGDLKKEEDAKSQIADSSEKSEIKENVQCESKEKTPEPVKPQEVTPEKTASNKTEGAVGGVEKSETVETETSNIKVSDTDKLKVVDPGLLKSPSSQSINRPPPDHTDKEEAVLDRLSGVGSEKKVSLHGILP